MKGGLISQWVHVSLWIPAAVNVPSSLKIRSSFWCTWWQLSLGMCSSVGGLAVTLFNTTSFNPCWLALIPWLTVFSTFGWTGSPTMLDLCWSDENLNIFLFHFLLIQTYFWVVSYDLPFMLVDILMPSHRDVVCILSVRWQCRFYWYTAALVTNSFTNVPRDPYSIRNLKCVPCYWKVNNMIVKYPSTCLVQAIYCQIEVFFCQFLIKAKTWFMLLKYCVNMRTK